MSGRQVLLALLQDRCEVLWFSFLDWSPDLLLCVCIALLHWIGGIKIPCLPKVIPTCLLMSQSHTRLKSSGFKFSWYEWNTKEISTEIWMESRLWLRQAVVTFNRLCFKCCCCFCAVNESHKQPPPLLKQERETEKDRERFIKILSGALGSWANIYTMNEIRFSAPLHGHSLSLQMNPPSHNAVHI